MSRISLAFLCTLHCAVGFNVLSCRGENTAGRNAAAAESRPNFIFLITDDISPGDLSVYGNQFVQTPNLAKLASEGLVFDNAYLTISSCSPSRCSMITGRYPHNTGAPELHTALPPDQTTFVQKLQQAGYYTVLSGKNHMGPPKQLGFDENSESKPAGSEKWVEELKSRPKDQPFFCWFASYDAHYPMQMNDKAPTYDEATSPVPPMMFNGPLTRKELSKYYHEVSRTDHYAGELMKELKAQGVADSTYFIYCSDNGRPFPRCKSYLYDSGIKTPLLVVGPDVATGRTNSLVSAIDFSATMLELAGVDKPETVQGVSFEPILRDPQAMVRDVAYAERNWHDYKNHERAVRSGDWLYIWNAWPENHNVSSESSGYEFPAAEELWRMAAAGKLTPAQELLTRTPQPAEMLFNVREDPHQFNNLANDSKYQAPLARLRGLLQQWQAETGDSVPKNPTPSRWPLHEDHQLKPIVRGDLPGADHQAAAINRSGPIDLE